MLIENDIVNNPIVKELLSDYLVFNFANCYCNTNYVIDKQNGTNKNKSDYSFNDTIYGLFVDYFVKSNISNNSNNEFSLNRKQQKFVILDSLMNAENSQTSKQIYQGAITSLIATYKNILLTNNDCKTELSTYLDYAIKFRLLNDKDFYSEMQKSDNVLKAAIVAFSDGKYNLNQK